MWDLGDIFNFYTTQWDSYENRLVENTENNGYEIDTAYCNDTCLYETGIRKYDGEWVIVEEYTNKDAAIKGHKKWVKFTNNNPKSAYSIQFKEPVEF